MTENMDAKYKKYAPTIKRHLHKKYVEKGYRNFYFKSRQLKEDTGLSGLVIGRTMRHLRDTVTIWSSNNSNSKTYLTKFK